MVFVFFSVFFFSVVFNGSGEVAQRATSLGPKPSLFVLVCVFCFVFFALFLFVFGGRV